MTYLIWNPDRNLFIIPYIDHPVTWYGFLFALGFLIGYLILRKMMNEFFLPLYSSRSDSECEATKLTDNLAFYITIGAVIGARLGHVFFYDWAYYKHHLIDIFKIWEGGLASHGGALGILVALILFAKKSKKYIPQIHFLALLDMIVVPTSLAGALIRLGNFINQEITGIPTQLPWGIIFGNPMDGMPGIPLHPVQLYESLFYLALFCFLYVMWYLNKKTIGRGLISGWFFFSLFGFRFLIEYLKMPQNVLIDTGWIKMGQWLSFPFILLGLFLIIRASSYVKQAR